MAQKSIVLLKNEKAILPLASDLESIAVIGPNAHTAAHMLGDYSYFCAMEGLLNLRADNNHYNVPIQEKLQEIEIATPLNTILAGIQARVGTHTRVGYQPGCDVAGDDKSGFEAAVAFELKSSVAIVVVGGKSGTTENATCGEHRDRADLHLPGVQEELIRTIRATGTPVVAVLSNGRPLNISWLDQNVPAILEAWLPGEQGAEAIADVLFGDVNPSGKLAIIFPRSVGQIPIYYRSKPTSNLFHHGTTVEYEYVDLTNKPLYPFRYGLSYTTFALDQLELSQTQVAVGEALTLSVNVANTGQVAGSEVIQLYARDVSASVTHPIKELKGFKRVYLLPGEAQTIRFEVFANQFGFYDQSMQYILEPGIIKLMVGTSAEHLPLETEINLVGPVSEISADKVFFSTTTTDLK